MLDILRIAHGDGSFGKRLAQLVRLGILILYDWKRTPLDPTGRHDRLEVIDDRIQGRRLAELVRHNLKTVRSYLLKEDFQFFWGYISPYWAGRFLDQWCNRTLRSQLEPMKRVARMLRGHRQLLLNWFRAKGQFSSGVVEGFNTKAKLTTRKAFGFRSYHAAEVAPELFLFAAKR